MKLHKGWIVTTPYGDELIIVNDPGLLRWAKRRNYNIKRTFILR